MSREELLSWGLFIAFRVLFLSTSIPQSDLVKSTKTHFFTFVAYTLLSEMLSSSISFSCGEKRDTHYSVREPLEKGRLCCCKVILGVVFSQRRRFNTERKLSSKSDFFQVSSSSSRLPFCSFSAYFSRIDSHTQFLSCIFDPLFFLGSPGLPSSFLHKSSSSVSL